PTADPTLHSLPYTTLFRSVIRHCAGKQQALIGAKTLEHGAHERRGMIGDDGGAAPQPEHAAHRCPGLHFPASPSARLRSASSTRDRKSTRLNSSHLGISYA